MKNNNLKIEYKNIDELIPYINNARKNNEAVANSDDLLSEYEEPEKENEFWQCPECKHIGVRADFKNSKH